MSTALIRPTTLEGLKRLAKKVKKELGVKHTEALDQVARQMGYSNFHAARRVLEGGARMSELATPVSASGQGKQVSPKDLEDFAYGRYLYRQGAPAPGFSGGEEYVIAGWLAEKAGVEPDARFGFAERAYDGIRAAAGEYTGDRGWAETLTMYAMFRLSELCEPEEGARLREYAHQKYFAYGDEFGY